MRHETKLNLIGVIGPLFGTIPPILLGYYTSDPFWYYASVIGYITNVAVTLLTNPKH